MPDHGESQRQFARRIGVSQPRVNQLIKDGLPVLANGRVDTRAALRWLEQNLDHERSVRAKQGSAGAATGSSSCAAPPGAPPTASPSGPVTGAPMAEIRRQHEIVKVARDRLRLETEKGRVVNRDEVKVAIFNRARKERNAHLAWALRVAPLMAAELGVDPALMFTCLDRHLREHLAELAKTPLLELPE